MPIIYVLVANGPIVLAEYSPKTGNFTEIVRKILNQIPIHRHKKTYAADDTLFHYLVDDNGLVFMCMADTAAGHRIPFALLDDVRNKFLAQFGKQSSWKGKRENELDDTFGRILKERLEYFNTPEADQVRRVRGEIDHVKEVMIQNIDKVLLRGEKIEVLVNETDKLQTKSFSFKQESTRLKRRLWWKNMYLWVCICVLLLAIIVVLVAIFMWYFGLFEKIKSAS